MEHNKGSHGREKSYGSSDKSVFKRGSGLNLGGPVGSSNGYSGRTGGRKSGGGTVTKAGGGITLAILLLSLLFGNGGNSSSGPSAPAVPSGQNSGHSLPVTQNITSSPSSNGWVYSMNNGTLIDTVKKNSRSKRTEIIGNGKDEVTIMVYMCGTDLESKSGMATSDIMEMVNSKIADNVNLLVYTGGCSKWRNQVFSSQYNQIYQVKEGGVAQLKSYPSSSMTDPGNLTEFIRFCNENYPANRRELILWDHGGGSVSGYGYDEKYARSGSMTLEGINQALKDANTTFDFIGFDACLMATMENALMLDRYADYLIASEELEPGNGWYYTNWISSLSDNTSIPTLTLGKQIVDDYISFYQKQGHGTSVTLSVTDLAELGTYGPKAMNSFANETTKLIKANDYKRISNARSSAREFSAQSKIDQIDLTHLAINSGTAGGKELADVICSAVKYNRVSANMTNSYGLSIYFPYRKVSALDKMVRTYKAIGMEDDYSKCIQAFASVETAGQAASGGTGDPLGALLNGYTGSSSSTSQDVIVDILSSILTGGYGGIRGLDSSNTAFLDSSEFRSYSSYVAENQFISGNLLFQQLNGHKVLKLSDDQWDMIQDLQLNVFYDDGEGYIDLGMDNVYEFIDDGVLLAEYDGTWLSIDGNPVAYYFLDETYEGNSYTITGRVPAMLNGERVDLILAFTDEIPEGYVRGFVYSYAEGETDTIAKEIEGLKEGDVIDFICDYYAYDGSFINNYYLGDQMTVDDELTIRNIDISSSSVKATYCLRDIYSREYWTPDFN